jgi:hypothetical protein
VAARDSHRSPRAEFGLLYLTSLIEFAQERVDTHRRQNRRVRTWLAARRLRELERYRDARHAPLGTVAPPPPLVAFAVASAALVTSVLVLVVATAQTQDELARSTADVGMLILTAVWFALAVACAPRAPGGDD